MISKIFTKLAKFDKNATKLARFYRSKKGIGRKKKEQKTGSAASDEKLVKLTKKEDIAAREAREARMRERREKRINLAKNFDYELSLVLDPEINSRIKASLRRNDVDLEANPLGMQELYYSTVAEYIEETKDNDDGVTKFVDEETEKELFSPLNLFPKDTLEDGRFKDRKTYMTTDDIINSKFYKSGAVQPSSTQKGKRVGAMAYKVGMMSIYDDWGILRPITVLHLDRNQIIQHFTEEKNGFNAMQVGFGEKSLNTINKCQMGHFLKAGVHPKRHLKQFNVDPEHFLPIGFQIGPRHFTPGQFVDVISVAKNKGTTGAVRKWGFKGQSNSHGTTKTHRSLGSTGQCQDAGRVFKGKRMHGRQGGKRVPQRNLKVFRVDHNRSLIFVQGTVPGKIGEVVQIKDAWLKWEENQEILNYPTFIPKEGVKYANIVQMEAPEDDPNEFMLHDEALPKDDDEVVSAAPVEAEE